MKTFKEVVQKIEEGHHVKIDEMSDTMLLRHAMTEELDAVILYERLAHQAKDARVKTLLLEIAHEEKIHAEELEEALERLDPAYEDAEDQAEEEVEQIFGPEQDD